jgi:hypothetical protein
MNLFDSMKDKVKEQQEKMAEVKDARGNKLASLTIEYMGGYGDKKKANGSLTFYQKQTEFKVPLRENVSFTIPNTSIADITFDGKDNVIQQRTITRNVLLFGKSKQQEIKDAYMVIVLSSGQEVLFHVKETSPMQLKAKLAGAVSNAKQGQPVASSVTSQPHGSVADELTKLANLKEQGVITQAEFDNKKAQLLGL